MWEILTLAVLWGLAAPIAAIVFAVVANNRSRQVLRRLDDLEARLARASVQAVSSDAVGLAVEPPPAVAPLDAIEPVVEPRPVLEAQSESITAESTPLATGAALPTAPAETLESKIGARWSVVVGGLALALGAVFLVKVSIERGLLSPAMRVGLGCALAAFLLICGELLRRRDRLRGTTMVSKADVPAILTAAGSVAAFASVYAAYALYGLIDSAPAFVLLTLVGLVTLLLSAIHGPGLAALGLLGAYATPLLVSNADPKPLPLAVHTLVVTAAVLALARIRRWAWLALAGIVASLAWGVLTGWIVDANTTLSELLLVFGLTTLFAGILSTGNGPPHLRDRQPNLVALVGVLGAAALAVLYAFENPLYPKLAAGIVLSGLIGAAASRSLDIAAAALIAGVVAVATIMLLQIAPGTDFGDMQLGAFTWKILGAQSLGDFAMRAASISLVAGLGGFFTADRLARSAPASAGDFAACGAGAPFLIMIVIYLRHVPFETRPAFGVAALVMAAIFSIMAERLIGKRPGDVTAPAPAFYAAGAVLALAFALAVGLEVRFIPLAFSLGAAGVVWVAFRRPVAVLPWLAVLLAIFACLALVRHPSLSVAEIGVTPILNGLVVRFGLPAFAILLAGEMLRRRSGGVPAGLLQAIGMALLAVFVVLEIRHFANNGILDFGAPGLGEQSALTLAALFFSLGLQQIAGRTGNAVYRTASLVAGLIGAAEIAFAHFVTVNPVFTGESVGTHPVINLLLPGYLLPALVAAWIAAIGRRFRPRWYVLVFAALALALGFTYVTLMVRHSFHGERLDSWTIADAENWTYSAIWLAFGIALLAAGILLRSVTVRAASGIVLAAVVCKVFLFDMAALTGALRAASFLGLGAVLIIIGRLYQRLLGRGNAQADTPVSPAGASGR